MSNGVLNQDQKPFESKASEAVDRMKRKVAKACEDRNFHGTVTTEVHIRAGKIHFYATSEKQTFD